MDGIMSRVFIDKNPANIHNADLCNILAQSPTMLKALGECPDNEQQAVFNEFNRLMWEMHETAIKGVKQATERRALRAIQVGDAMYEPQGPLVEIKEGTQPKIETDADGSFYAIVETPDTTLGHHGTIRVDFKKKG